MKRAIVIGCGNIGFAAIKRLVSSSYEVFAFDIQCPDHLADYMNDNKSVHFGNIIANDDSSVESAFSSMSGSIDYVVSTVGIINFETPFDNIDEFDKVVDVNVMGNIIPIQYLVKNGIVTRGSRIAIIASTSAHFVYAQTIAYPTSKWILYNVCVCLQKELEEKGIYVDIISPSSIANQYSKTFDGAKGVRVDDITRRIFGIKTTSKGASVFVPSYYSIFHLIERCMPWMLDIAYRLKPHCIRRRQYTNRFDRVIITGASSGLGKELAFLFASECKTLYIVARRLEILNEMKEKIEESTRCTVIPISADLSEKSGCLKIIEEIVEGVDLVINNAGVQYWGNICDMSADKYRNAIQTNCLSPIRLTGMLMKGGNNPKTIVNIISTTAISGRRGIGTYSSTKAGLWSFSKALRRVYGNQINVIDVIPATFESALGRNGRAQADKIASDRVLSSSRQGMTSKSVAKIVHEGVMKRKDVICIPSVKVRLFIWFEALCPSLFNKIFK